MLPGVRHIAKFVKKIEDRHDLWLVYELGGQSLSKALFEIKGEFYKGERIYNVNHGTFYKALRDNRALL